MLYYNSIITFSVFSLVACCLMSLSSDLIEKVPLPKDELFNSTKKAIAEGAKESGKPDYVPIWLDEIQTTVRE